MKAKSVWLTTVLSMVIMTMMVGMLALPCSAASEEHAISSVNINTAGAAELSVLPGIGESKANAIISYRSEHGPFSSVNELTKVRGIGTGLLEKIRDLVQVK